MMLKGRTFDTAVGDAAAQAEIKTKNEKIETMKIENEKVPGDGMPDITSKNTEVKETKKPELDAFSKSLNDKLERQKNIEDVMAPGNTE